MPRRYPVASSSCPESTGVTTSPRRCLKCGSRSPESSHISIRAHAWFSLTAATSAMIWSAWSMVHCRATSFGTLFSNIHAFWARSSCSSSVARSRSTCGSSSDKKWPITYSSKCNSLSKSSSDKRVISAGASSIWVSIASSFFRLKSLSPSACDRSRAMARTAACHARFTLTTASSSRGRSGRSTITSISAGRETLRKTVVPSGLRSAVASSMASSTGRSRMRACSRAYSPSMANNWMP
mmetsp:Transcript_747/g.1144  ORF Transcript_747/g.1144 Transcript_747/m.1144 type:complete len:239 (+) Transcript_747:278-994(+)